MEVDILNARDCGLTPGFGYGEANRIAVQRTVEAMRRACGRTIYIQAAVYKASGAINVQISTAASARGTILRQNDGSPTLVQSVGNGTFVVTDAQDNGFVGHALSEGLALRGAFQASDGFRKAWRFGLCSSQKA